MSQFCYLSSELPIHQHGNVNFLIDAATTSLPIYFALKGKHEYEMLGVDKFIEDMRAVFEQFASQFDLVVFPESRYPFLKEITKNIPNVLELKKRTKDEICDLVKNTKGWKKQDLESAKKSWDEMGQSFTINKIKSNKRKDYIPYLFEQKEIATGSKVLLLDDFVMSGNTIKAMELALGIKEYSVFGVFYQISYGGN
jgi:glycerophosphoryl diester phosphodiesterase